jgi:hypothetical protein
MDDKTYSLFDDHAFAGGDNHPKNALRIVPGKKQALSKNQIAFNKLTARIERLHETIRNETAKLEQLLKIYAAELSARRQELARTRLKLAMTLGNSAETLKYGKRQREQLRAVILDLCDQAFAAVEPDEDTEAFYDRWSAASYREELENQSAMMKQMFADGAREFLGIDLDLDELDDTPEGLARLMNRLKNEAKDGGPWQEGRRAKGKKSKKQLEREERKKQEEALQQKSLRSIYLALAKALHPDTIMDPGEKVRKEALMKKVTAAYADKDLAALLTLEMEWVSSENAALGSLPEEKLKLYIASLKEQVAALEQEKHALYHHPRFNCLSEFSRYPLTHAKQRIHAQAREHTTAVKGYKGIMAVFSRPNPKKEILEFVSAYLALTEVMDPFSQDIPF